MKFNPVGYSSAVGEIWVMATFKVKYCHKIFNFPLVRCVCWVAGGCYAFVWHTV
ncbi:MAG: hypothetical protein ABIG95_03370 [Candidatus Woesearchaeota archaeon]